MLTAQHNLALLEDIEQYPVDNDLKTILDMMRWTYSCFNASDLYYGHGHDNPWDEANQLVLCALSLPIDVPESLYQSNLSLLEKRRIIEMVKQRLGLRKPVAYLTRSAWFCGLEFYVDERVIIPRSPIGELIGQGFTGILRTEPKRILDMCTGSGCIAIACAQRFPNAEIDAVDLSIDALNVAEINIDRHDVNDKVFPLQSDLFESLPLDQYDLIIANPPYVDQEDLDTMPEEFQHEPEMALGSGIDGLTITKRILATAADYLSDNGVLVCEVGNSMLHLMEQFPTVPFNWLEFQNGGIGVFSLTKEQLTTHQTLFSLATHQN